MKKIIILSAANHISDRSSEIIRSMRASGEYEVTVADPGIAGIELDSLIVDEAQRIFDTIPADPPALMVPTVPFIPAPTRRERRAKQRKAGNL